MEPEGIDRRLAAILSADVASYGRHMAEDEVATLQRLTTYREQIGVRVGERGGRVVDSPGDNLLAEFSSALEATRCAIEIQRVLGERNADLPPERRMEFRVGVHLGDVMVQGGRIYGDGVNIAARLEGLAEPGGVCISRAVREQVQDKLGLGYEDLGEQLVKNIPRPVHAYRVRVEGEAPVSPRPARRLALRLALLLLLVLGGLLLWNLGRDRADEQLTVPGFGGVPAIAVLPFDNLSDDPDQEYFADGVAEDLITRLSTRRVFPVIARNSSFVYKGKAVDVKRVSRELGVRYVVEGSVRKARDRVRISAQLVDATTGHHVWAQTYDRELRDIFALQDEISEAIVASMLPELRQSEYERAARREPRDLDAYDLCMRGFWHQARHTGESNAMARSMFQRAVDLDPRLVQAFFGLALSHYEAINKGWTDSRAGSLAEIERAAKRCVAIDDRHNLCQVALGMLYGLMGRQDEMIAALELALELNPSDAQAYANLGTVLALAGRPDEAIANLEKAVRLSPRDPRMSFFCFGLGCAHFGAGRYQEAVDWAQRGLRHRGEYEYCYRLLAASYAQLGRLEEARKALEQDLELEPDLSIAKLRVDLSFAAPAFLEPYLGGLREAGLREE